MASNSSSARKPAGRKPAATQSATKQSAVKQSTLKQSASKQTATRKASANKTAKGRTASGRKSRSADGAGSSRFSFPSIDQMIASTRAALNDHESALGKAEQIVEKARAAMGDAEKMLLAKTKVARAKGTAAAKTAMKNAKLQRKKADQLVGVAKGKYKELKAGYDSSMVKLKKITQAQEKLLSAALKEEQKLLRKLMKAEGDLLKSVNGGAPAKIARKKVTRKKTTSLRGRSRLTVAPA